MPRKATAAERAPKPEVKDQKQKSEPELELVHSVEEVEVSFDLLELPEALTKRRLRREVGAMGQKLGYGDIPVIERMAKGNKFNPQELGNVQEAIKDDLENDRIQSSAQIAYAEQFIRFSDLAADIQRSASETTGLVPMEALSSLSDSDITERKVRAEERAIEDEKERARLAAFKPMDKDIFKEVDKSREKSKKRRTEKRRQEKAVARKKKVEQKLEPMTEETAELDKIQKDITAKQERIKSLKWYRSGDRIAKKATEAAIAELQKREKELQFQISDALNQEVRSGRASAEARQARGRSGEAPKLEIVRPEAQLSQQEKDSEVARIKREIAGKQSRLAKYKWYRSADRVASRATKSAIEDLNSQLDDLVIDQGYDKAA